MLIEYANGYEVYQYVSTLSHLCSCDITDLYKCKTEIIVTILLMSGIYIVSSRSRPSISSVFSITLKENGWSEIMLN